MWRLKRQATARLSDGATTAAVDQAALHGLLQKVRDVGLPLVSVICVGPDQPGVPTVEPR
jgi:hypothetical protein